MQGAGPYTLPSSKDKGEAELPGVLPVHSLVLRFLCHHSHWVRGACHYTHCTRLWHHHTLSTGRPIAGLALSVRHTGCQV